MDDNSKGEPPSIHSSAKPSGGPPGKAKSSGGPAGRAKPSNGPPKAKPKNGPPGASTSAISDTTGADPSSDQNPQPAQPEVDLQATAAAHFGALDSLIPQTTETAEVSSDLEQPVSTVVVDWNELPGGGDYEYTSDATYYSGENCGKWLLNEDKSFTRIE
jgi:hypothetical protein